VKYIDPQDSAVVFYNDIDENYIDLLGHTLMAGRNFIARPDQGGETEVIVNEQLIKRFHIGGNDPEKAIGEFITVDGKKLFISGVVRDFHYGKVDSDIGPFMFRNSNSRFEYLNAKIVTTDLPATLSRIGAAWKRVDPVHELKATFYDDQIQHAYSEYSAMIRTIGFLSFLAIVISSMGLLGMVVFSTETRIREISIRKVFGAGVLNLIYLLSRGFLILLTIAGLIAIPVTYLIFDKIVLSDVTFHSPIGYYELFSGTLGVLSLALILVGSQTFRVARANPAEVLKNE
jgi:ABC-type antimicrobial peptide transport system permease subunit